MDKSLLALCNALKKVLGQLKPQSNPLSFLLVISKTQQGKTTLLNQSNLLHVTVESERNVDVYYNNEGVIVELDETWLNCSNHHLQSTLKQLNRCHRSVKISGILYCVDTNELFLSDGNHFPEQIKGHLHLLRRLGLGLGYQISLALVFTKMDSLVGFCDFFQNDHTSELKKPLGFSLPYSSQKETIIANYRRQFDHMIEMLEQKVLSKMHPVRSSLKRTLIRELPLQLASLRSLIQSLVHNIPLQGFRLKAVYFTSAKQGGISEDRLNKKIKQEYALVVQDRFHQSINHRAYFVEGAILTFQKQTQQRIRTLPPAHRWGFGLGTVAFVSLMAWIGYHHFQSSLLLDEVSQELLSYETLAHHSNTNTPAAFHLSKASSTLNHLSSNSLSMPTIERLKTNLRHSAEQNLHGSFLPLITQELEKVLSSSTASHASRYQALKIYLMFALPKHFSFNDVDSWFTTQWKNDSQETLQKKRALLQQVFHQPLQPLPINQPLIRDVRNYLNALPASYLFYSIAKAQLTDQKTPVSLEGFQLAFEEIPVYLTKAEFKKALVQLSEISKQLQQENWVLERPDVQDLGENLQKAYTYEYVTWWQTFIQKSRPARFHNYENAHLTLKQLIKSEAFTQFIALVQQNTAPDLGSRSPEFNQDVATHFSQLNIISSTAIKDLTTHLSELEKLLHTLAVIHDDGKTAFTLTKNRFIGDGNSNPFTMLVNRAPQLPSPIANWITQIADDSWFLLINSSKTYINQQWHQTVYDFYKHRIANRFPFSPNQSQEVAIADFDQFFSSQGLMRQFAEYYLKPFLNTDHALWKAKAVNNYALPFTTETLNELIRANVITTMFYPANSERCRIDFTLQKINLDPIIANLQLNVGENWLKDDQISESFARFHWPQANAKLSLTSIEGQYYELEESGPWALFKILQKVNVFADNEDTSMLQILFEINGNSGRYLLRTHNQVNPFIPGILNGFHLPEQIV